MKIARVLLVSGLIAASAFAVASPKSFITHNRTSVESNAYIDGTIPSPYPTPAGKDKSVMWELVRLACIGHTTNGKCAAVVKMAANTKNPIDVAKLSMNLDSGAIALEEIYSTAFTITVNGPGEVTITQ